MVSKLLEMDSPRISSRISAQMSCCGGGTMMDKPVHSRLYSILRKAFLTIILIAGAILLEIRLIYAVFASVIVNLFFQWFGLEWSVVWRTLPRDLRGLTRLIALKFAMWKFSTQNLTVGEAFSRLAKKHPKKSAFLYEKQIWTFEEVEGYANKVATYFSSSSDNTGLESGDTVALLLLSRPEYVGLWLGISRAGLVGSLVNCQLRGEPLLHSLKVCNAKAVVVGEELYSALTEVQDRIPATKVYVIGDRGAPVSVQLIGNAVNLDVALSAVSDRPVRLHPQKSRSDRLFYVYTSGTTGLPKAAIITHNRFFYLAMGIRKMGCITSSDVMYCTLPLYHTAGGILGVGQALLGGTTVVLRKKFSASQFWIDCATYKCTVGQYIGEICRYLLVQKPSPADRSHGVRMMVGNGMRAPVWDEFQKRFQVAQVLEFYGATEGNASLVNIDNKIGAVGFVSRILPCVYPVRLIKVEKETGEPVRDGKGMCISCGPGESGELVGKIKTSGMHKFDGYCNKDATQRKIVRDVFAKGDLGFLSGDIMEMDDCGYMFFKDRTGDTFRWRGENVSTNEVEEVISRLVKYGSVVVFGVEVPGCEGRAGMVCITGDCATHDLQSVNARMKSELPSYARPLFIRFLMRIEETGTYKLMKSRLRDEAFDPQSTNGDKVFYLDPKLDEYCEMNEGVYQQILGGQIRY